MKNEIKSEILSDINRAKYAMESTLRNLNENDILTAANRNFVACENTIFAILKLRFGSATISRKRISMKLDGINPKFKKIYDISYDLRVQADYGKKSNIEKLNKESLDACIKDVRKILEEVEKEIKENLKKESS